MQLTVAFCTRVALEAWVARKREGSRWRVRNFIVVAELGERRGTVEMNKRRARGGGIEGLIYLSASSFLYSWCVAQLRRNCTQDY